MNNVVLVHVGDGEENLMHIIAYFIFGHKRVSLDDLLKELASRHAEEVKRWDDFKRTPLSICNVSVMA